MSAFKHKKSLVLLHIIILTVYEEDDFKKFNIKKFIIKYEELVKTFIISGSKKVTKFQKFTSKFNVHLKLYYYLITSEFIVSLNYITFFNKDKYRLILIFQIISFYLVFGLRFLVTDNRCR